MIADVAIQDYMNAAALQLVTHIGTDAWQKRLNYPILASATATYCVLMLNAIMSSVLRHLPAAQYDSRYYSASVTQNYSTLQWRLDAADIHPTALTYLRLGIFKPTTVIHFDWINGRYLAPCLIGGANFGARIQPLMYNPNITFTGAGIILLRGLRTFPMPTIQRPGTLLLPWQQQSATPQNVTEMTFAPQQVYNLGTHGY